MQKLAEQLKKNISTVISGKDEIIEKVIFASLGGGHLLLEDIPGVGKTTLAKSLAVSCGCDFTRIQFVPDLLPSDVTGINYFNPKSGEFTFKKGAVFTNILLADEINRAAPRTQSALLECMEEKQVSVDGTTYPLAAPFFVIATQNPIEIKGTFPLPEAQLDRFMMRLSMGYPDKESEFEMMRNFSSDIPLEKITAVTSAEELSEAQAAVRTVKISADVREYIYNIVNATRNTDKIKLGASPRGTLMLIAASRARAAANGRDFVLPDDVKALACDVLSHRIIAGGYNITHSAAGNIALIDGILSAVPVPKEEF